MLQSSRGSGAMTGMNRAKFTSCSLVLAAIAVPLLVGCASKTVEAPAPVVTPMRPAVEVSVLTFGKPELLGATPLGQQVDLGGFSALQVDRIAKDKLIVTTVTDRGPNGSPIALVTGVGRNARAFLLPHFAPSLVKLELLPATGEVKMLERRPLKRTPSRSFTGLPRPATEAEAESAMTVKGDKIAPDPHGIDPEGYCRMPNGSFWVSEEYGPDVLEFGSRGILQRKLSPGKGLPELLKWRPANRGFEALVCAGDKVYAFLQSPLKMPASKHKKVMRVFEIDARAGKTTGVYFFLLEDEKIDRVGDALMIRPGEFLFLEQNGKGGADAVHRIVRLKLGAATNLLTLRRKFPDLLLLEPEEWTDQEIAERLTPMSRETVADLAGTAINAEEKIEGMALVDARTLLIVTDNDFGLKGDFSLETGTVAMDEGKKSKFAIVRFPVDL